VALIRCTCIYRVRTGGEQEENAPPLRVLTRDPWCPSWHLHEWASNAAAGDLPRR